MLKLEVKKNTKKPAILNDHFINISIWIDTILWCTSTRTEAIDIILRVICFNLSHSRCYYHYFFFNWPNLFIVFNKWRVFIDAIDIYLSLTHSFFIEPILYGCMYYVCMYVCLSFIPLFHYLHIQVGMIDLCIHILCFCLRIQIWREENSIKRKTSNNNKTTNTMKETVWLVGGKVFDIFLSLATH